jgi:hypothetical protein
LGPEERSFGSLALKTKKKIENFYLQYGEKSPWFEVNPGLKAKLSNNPFSDIEQIVKHPTIVLFADTFFEKENQELTYQKDFTVTSINSINGEYASCVFIFDINEQLQKIELNTSFDKATIGRLKINKTFDEPQLVSILNYVLDKKEKN